MVSQDVNLFLSRHKKDETVVITALLFIAANVCETQDPLMVTRAIKGKIEALSEDYNAAFIFRGGEREKIRGWNVSDVRATFFNPQVEEPAVHQHAVKPNLMFESG
jgi:hypothetical protein